AGWSVVVRRVAEFFGAGAVVFLVLFVPVWLSMGKLYPWLHPEEAQHEAVVQVQSDQRLAQHEEQAKPEGKASDATKTEVAAHVRPDPEAEEHAEIMHKKAAWLNQSSFLLRAFLYLVIWGVMGTVLLRNSV